VTSAANHDQADYWNELAPSWIEAERHTHLVGGPFGEAAMQRLGLAAGQSALDIGCGTGDTTAALAATAGSALGVDIAAAMIAEAQRRHAGTNADFQVADVQVDDLGGRRFDAAFSRFGVMFFEDLTAAFINIHNLLVPGGRLAFASWADLFANEWMFVPGSAVVTVTGTIPPMPGPGEPGPFTLADADVITATLTAAGFSDVEVAPLERVIDLPADEVESMVQLSRGVGPVREAIVASDDEHLTDRILAAVREALHEKVEHDRLRLTAVANIVSATA
jgi:SAM-dependent methyltransferase